jgi:hypothetical protein
MGGHGTHRDECLAHIAVGSWCGIGINIIIGVASSKDSESEKTILSLGFFIHRFIERTKKGFNYFKNNVSRIL